MREITKNLQESDAIVSTVKRQTGQDAKIRYGDFHTKMRKKRLAISSSLCIIIFALGVIAQLVRALR